ncbi:polysaccharide deacetylase family protein [Serratia ureilytica]|uniref:Polysaccharide deacetylase family protein n=1 Tax=Serratia ureilytica TaxID=300181 RepID=A0ABU0VKI8_9GAMM|nr:polysaccharide deacetylase family protein [Serratia ureilytica]MCU7060960.1 polysaccharide deacetylase family protein [Serratia ureilytica]MDQ1810455.1 polysaccharide deacetylase family protein [Serratia ureilytica]MDQ1839309.1 polysaccharide deacetylase family protein [Serratia ureilytica]MDQ1861951.1 polysaccharide deacetylase family protein [Serratia ureilytica]
MRSQYTLTAGLLGILMSLVSPLSLANLLSEDGAVKSEYMEAQRDSEVYALVGEHVIPVGEVKRGQLIQVFPADAEYYEFKFGHGTGFIDKDDVRELKKSRKVQDDLGELNKPLTNQNLITQKAIDVYTAADKDSEVFGTLEGNLRYPIIGKLKDRLNNTWYEVNIGDRLGFVNELDCEIDNGIPVLTYHHLLKNEENKRFRHTSTTTSDVAFSNQMTYLKQAGYDTISLYQLEAYLKNQINLPGKAIVLTFDDGLKSVYRYAYPVLKDYGFRATAFIISSRIKRHPQKWNPDSLQFMSVSELKQIQDVFDVQSHTHFLHRTDGNRQPILLSRSLHNIEFDFERSRRALSQFNPHVLYLSYPFGGYNQRAIQAAQGAGFHLAVTTVQGKVKPGDNPYTLKRLYILRTDSIQTMADRIANKPGTVVQ